MPKVSEKHDLSLERVERGLTNLNIVYERNDVELVLVEHEFDVESTIDAFRSGAAKEVLKDWNSTSRKKQRQEISKTSTPRMLGKKLQSSANASSCLLTSPKMSTEESDTLSQSKLPSWIAYDKINQDIQACEQSIDKYEGKIERCMDMKLRDYYIQSALQKREEIRLLVIYKTKVNDSQTAEQIGRLSSNVDYLLAQNSHRIRSELDCWDSSSTRTKEEQQEFKNKLILYYECGSPTMKTIKCMILNKYFDRSLVRAAHIWKAATNGVGLTEFQLGESNVNDERNGLLLFESIEKAFDSKKLCFIYDPFAGLLRLKLLYNDLKTSFVVADQQMRETLHETRTFADIDNAILTLPNGIYPYRRLLNWHGRCSYRTAKSKNWIGLDEHLEDFFHLSDLISLPGDEDDDVDQ